MPHFCRKSNLKIEFYEPSNCTTTAAATAAAAAAAAAATAATAAAAAVALTFAVMGRQPDFLSKIYFD